MLRLLVTPRWLGWTLLAVLAVGVCGVMAWWQVVRLESPGGSLLNAGYALQWPLFALFFAFMWARLLQREAQSLRDEHAEGPSTMSRSGPAPVRAPVDSPFGPRPAAVVADSAPAPDSARARRNARFAELASGTGSSTPAPPRREDRS